MLRIESPKGLSPTGVGPMLLVGQLFLVGAAFLVTPAATPPPLAVRVVGLCWAAAGIALWASTLRVFLRQFPEGTLIVDGPYRYSRHPLYASLIVFVTPGLALITGAWMLLVAALAGVALAYPLILSEERELERTFGDEWIDYRARTSWLFPFPPRR